MNLFVKSIIGRIAKILLMLSGADDLTLLYVAKYKQIIVINKINWREK